MASITAFLVTVLIAPFMIRFLSKLNFKQTIEREGFSKLYEQHKGKDKVPTMGGFLILGGVVVSTVLWADILNRYVLLSLLTMVWLGAIGFVDDWLKLSKKNSKGLTAANKIFGQLAIGIFIGTFLYFDSPGWQQVSVPFFKNWLLAMGPLYIVFVVMILVGASNAVNLTDGLDGLAIGCTSMIALTYGIFSYVTGNVKFSDYLQIPFIPGTGELAVFCAVLFGASIGFLWFNSHPASVFMGDTGSLALGGALGVVAIFTKKEILLAIVGGVFVMEALSVMIQVTSYKLHKKRIFLMAPIHHHFQLKGLSESKVVIRFWIISLILALTGLAALKLQ